MRRSRAAERLTRPPEPSPPRVWIIASNDRTAAHLAMLHARANVAVLYLSVRSAAPAKRVRSGSTDIPRHGCYDDAWVEVSTVRTRVRRGDSAPPSGCRTGPSVDRLPP